MTTKTATKQGYTMAEGSFKKAYLFEHEGQSSVESPTISRIYNESSNEDSSEHAT